MTDQKPSFMLTLKRYYWLTKPGIIYGNLVAAVAGYLYGAAGHYVLQTFVAMVLGTALVIGCGCVLNNILDIPLDSLMERTKTRALVTKKISLTAATIYAVIIGITGFFILAKYTNKLTVYNGIVGLVFYVAVYGYAKRKSVHGTLVGTVSGATPLLAGYFAATNRFDQAAVLLFLIMLCWQMAHFYAIAIRHIADYKKAGVPVMPVVKGIQATKKHMVMYIVGFMVTSLLLAAVGHAGVFYSIVLFIIGVWWLKVAFKDYDSADYQVWAKKVFLFSLVALLVFNGMIAVNHYLP